jgi:DNA-binding YbaB/EbfC family protein
MRNFVSAAPNPKGITSIGQNMKLSLDELMKQAGSLGQKLEEMQAELDRIECEGVAGAGMVKVTMTGRHSVRRVSIDPKLLSEDRDMLEDLVAAAFNDAVRRVQEAQKGQFSQLPLSMLRS